jgi:hypothetical protein
MVRSRGLTLKPRLLRIVITRAAFDAICATLPLGSVGYENKANERGERWIWLDRAVIDRPRAMRGRGSRSAT